MKILKYSVIAVGIFLISAVGFFLYSISKLPDPVVIKQKLRGEEKEEEVQPKNEIQKEIANEATALAEDLAEEDPESVPEKTNPIENIMEITNEDYSDIQVCENLGKPSIEKITPDIMLQAISGENREDPYIESFRVPLKHVFQSKPVRELFTEIEGADVDQLKGEDRSNYLKKIGFYTFAANKAREIYGQKAEYEEVGDRAYHLYVISQIAHKKPELAQDKNLLDFCNQLQASIGNKATTNIEEERKELVKLIEYAGLTPQQLGFNPKIRTKFNLELNTKGLSFGFSHPGMNPSNKN